MFRFNKSKPTGEEIIFKIEGMHCSSCAMIIDGQLEDTEGVLKVSTSYAKSETKVNFDPQKITTKNLIQIINKAGYHANQV